MEMKQEKKNGSHKVTQQVLQVQLDADWRVQQATHELGIVPTVQMNLLPKSCG